MRHLLQRLLKKLEIFFGDGAARRHGVAANSVTSTNRVPGYVKADALGLTVFLVTHDLDTLYTICDRVAVLSQKKVLVCDRLDVVAATDDPWVQSYFHGPRGRAALQAAEATREVN